MSAVYFRLSERKLAQTVRRRPANGALEGGSCRVRKRRGTRRARADARPSAWAKSSGAQVRPLGRSRRFCAPYKSCRGIEYRRFTDDARSRGQSLFDLTSRHAKRLAPTAREARRRRCAAVARRHLLARGFCRACLLSPLQLDHPLAEVGHPLDRLDGRYQIHDLPRSPSGYPAEPHMGHVWLQLPLTSRSRAAPFRFS